LGGRAGDGPLVVLLHGFPEFWYGCLAEPDHDDVPNLVRVERLADASHWVHHDEAERVKRLLIDFFAPARPTETR